MRSCAIADGGPSRHASQIVSHDSFAVTRRWRRDLGSCHTSGIKRLFPAAVLDRPREGPGSDASTAIAETLVDKSGHLHVHLHRLEWSYMPRRSSSERLQGWRPSPNSIIPTTASATPSQFRAGPLRKCCTHAGGVVPKPSPHGRHLELMSPRLLATFRRRQLFVFG